MCVARPSHEHLLLAIKGGCEFLFPKRHAQRIGVNVVLAERSSYRSSLKLSKPIRDLHTSGLRLFAEVQQSPGVLAHRGTHSDVAIRWVSLIRWSTTSYRRPLCKRVWTYVCETSVVTCVGPHRRPKAKSWAWSGGAGRPINTLLSHVASPTDSAVDT